MKKSKIFTLLVIVAAAISMTSCNRGTGCPGQDLNINPMSVVSNLIK